MAIAGYDRLVQEHEDAVSLQSSGASSRGSRVSRGSFRRAIGTAATEEYVSPFRGGQLTKASKKQLQLQRTKKFPTVSATSLYNSYNTRELGFSKVTDDQRRARDIVFPEYLLENEDRQRLILKDLEKREQTLLHLQRCQSVLDRTCKPAKEEKRKELKAIEPVKRDTTNRFAIDYDFVPPVDPTQEEKDEIDVSDPIVREYIRDARGIPRAEANGGDASGDASGYDYDRDVLNIEQNQLVDAQQMALQNEIEWRKPVDPATQPKLYVDLDSLQLIDPGSTAVGVSTKQRLMDTPVTNPQATEDTPELLLKLPKYGHVSAAVFNKVLYDDKVHKAEMADYQREQESKFAKKLQEYEQKLAQVDDRKLSVLAKMNDAKLDKIAKSEVIENQKIKQLFDSNATFNDSKVKVLHEAQLVKLQKLQDLKFISQKKTLMQHEVNQLTLEKSHAEKDYHLWTTNLTNITERLDAQLFKLSQFNHKQDKITRQIRDLTQRKTELEAEIDANQFSKGNADRNLADLETGQHLKSHELVKVTDSIQGKLDSLAVVKQEISGERLKLIGITNEMERARAERERIWNEKLDSNTKFYEDKLGEKDADLDERLKQLDVEHTANLVQVREIYEAKLQDSAEKAEEAEQQLKLAAEEKAQIEKSLLDQEQQAKKELEDMQKERDFAERRAKDESERADQHLEQKVAIEMERKEWAKKIADAEERANIATKARVNAQHERSNAESELTKARNKPIFENNSLYSFATEEVTTFK
ncbi:uncharacterized protein KNAG_0B00810 [Huiozyma naganishii CBS 8797]|uniref:Uncharacterized protein n=1 Tax=Huiozyma naganishii (strain ATCC MYA-139 / BCRC 22969 / CBS 8797 / KCTC 17520 / NBRC 10181 / NCYC 3082 / Yp74L-3) TaxID=1071383 RepID=J7RG67_HUIN7|nr:hypothetical protein KNAG_0B00810 [Kazachstania naganishii CBS 8797]CCK68528.1 hypothetical protein KNAG_0B00810 [Kazachstania naganishii CBS 8797]